MYGSMLNALMSPPCAKKFQSEVKNTTVTDFNPALLHHNIHNSLFSGSLTLAMTNPIWITKTRLCLEYETQGRLRYRGMTHALTVLYKEDGFRGLYKV